MDFCRVAIKSGNFLSRFIHDWPNGFGQVVIKLEPEQDGSQAKELAVERGRAPPIVRNDPGVGHGSKIDQGVFGNPDNSRQITRNGFGNLDQSAEHHVQGRRRARRHDARLDAAQDHVGAKKRISPRGDHQLRGEEKNQNARSRRPTFTDLALEIMHGECQGLADPPHMLMSIAVKEHVGDVTFDGRQVVDPAPR